MQLNITNVNGNNSLDILSIALAFSIPAKGLKHGHLVLNLSSRSDRSYNETEKIRR